LNKWRRPHFARHARARAGLIGASAGYGMCWAQLKLQRATHLVSTSRARGTTTGDETDGSESFVGSQAAAEHRCGSNNCARKIRRPCGNLIADEMRVLPDDRSARTESDSANREDRNVASPSMSPALQRRMARVRGPWFCHRAHLCGT
jgi:hypothetical protein